MSKRAGLYITPTEFVPFAETGAGTRLSDHVATRDRSPDFTALAAWLPNPDPVLKKAGKDVQVYTELRTDAHVGGSIRRRKAALQGMEQRIVRDKASARATKLCEAVIAELDMRRLIHEISEAVLYGWQPLEVIWTPPSAGAIRPADVLAKPHPWFHFDAESRLRFRSRNSPLLGEELAPRKFLVAQQDASYVNPYGFADLSMCFWPTVFKRGGLRFWVTFTEKYGTPWVIGKQPRSAGQPEQTKLLDQLEAMVQDAVAAIPDDSSVEIIEAAGKGASADLYERLLMFCRSEVSIALLGQNQSTEAATNYASATAGLEVAKDLRDGDARLIEATINRLLRWVVDLNEGEAAPAPRFELYELEEVDQEQAKRDETLTRAGVRFTTAYWQRAYSLEDGDIDGDATPTSPLRGAAGPVAFADTEPARDGIDVLVDEAAADWQPMMDPLLATIQDELNRSAARGESAAELLARLPQLLGKLNAGPMTDSLTRAAFTARLAGDAGIETE